MVEEIYYRSWGFLYKMSIWMIIFCLLMYVVALNLVDNVYAKVFLDAASFFSILYIVLFISFCIMSKIDKGEK